MRSWSFAYCGSKEVRDKILSGILNTLDDVVSAFAHRVLAASAEDAASARLRSAFDYYDNLYKTKHPHFHQLFLAHYKAFKAGLTFNYNDSSSTTKQDVIDKLRLAAK